MVAETDRQAALISTPYAGWNVRHVRSAVWTVTVIIVLLGVAREAFVHVIGTGTALKDLRHISLDGELNIATWYSSSLMLAASALSLLASRLDSDGRQRRYWLMISAVMLLMSIDETASFHESLITVFDSWAQYSDYLHFAWVVVAIPFVILFGIVSVPFLSRLPRKTAARFVAAGVLFVFGALVMEMIDGAIQVRLGAESLAYRLGAMTEDAFELIGMSLFVTVLVSYVLRFTHVVEDGPLRRH